VLETTNRFNSPSPFSFVKQLTQRLVEVGGETEMIMSRITAIELLHTYYLCKAKTPKCPLDHKKNNNNMKENISIPLPKTKTKSL